MNESTPLDFARLADWIEGRLSPEEAARVARQVAEADEVTQADIAWLRAFHQFSQSGALGAPPAEVRRTLQQRFAGYARDRRQPGLFRRLVATLTGNSGLQVAGSGVRGAGPENTQRQLIYTTDVGDIALNVRLRPHDRRFDLDGQVLAADEAVAGPLSIQILRDQAEYGLTTTDDLGEFAFAAIPPGIYEIIFSTDQLEIAVAPIQLTPE